MLAAFTDEEAELQMALAASLQGSEAGADQMEDDPAQKQ